jgi:hypothetical protein
MSTKYISKHPRTGDVFGVSTWDISLGRTRLPCSKATRLRTQKEAKKWCSRNKYLPQSDEAISIQGLPS